MKKLLKNLKTRANRRCSLIKRDNRNNLYKYNNMFRNGWLELRSNIPDKKNNKKIRNQSNKSRCKKIK